MNQSPAAISPNTPFVCSWSGGKDSCLALYRAMRAGGPPRALLTMMIEDGERSRSHGLSRAVLEAQASAALGLRLVTQATSWKGYEEAFTARLRQFHTEGVQAVVFGDIDLEDHRLWEERVCAASALTPVLPLWQQPRRALLAELLYAGFQATIVAVRDGVLDPRFLGAVLSDKVIDDLEAAGADACGENGEYHTIVTDGPIFSRPLVLRHGERVLKDGCWFLDVAVNRP